jgi:hypothetical protein
MLGTLDISIQFRRVDVRIHLKIDYKIKYIFQHNFDLKI